MAIPSVLDLSAAVMGLLEAHATLTVYRSTADPTPPVDEGGVTEGYAVLHTFPGEAGANALSKVPGQLLWEFQVSCCGGDDDYTWWVVDTVRGLLDGKTLTVAGTDRGPAAAAGRVPAPGAAAVAAGLRAAVPGAADVPGPRRRLTQPTRPGGTTWTA
jgi:hypothetical protein